MFHARDERVVRSIRSASTLPGQQPPLTRETDPSPRPSIDAKSELASSSDRGRTLVLPSPATPAVPATGYARLLELAGIGRRHDPAVAAALLGLSVLPTALTPSVAHAEPPGASTGIPAGSLFNPKGVGNPSGGDPLFRVFGAGAQLDDRSARIPATPVVDPAAVGTANTKTSGAAEIRAMLMSHAGAPRTAEVIAQRLAELYGPYTVQNTAANRLAIIENIRWITDTGTGINYNQKRADHPTPDTQPPNVTLSTNSGVCRDIHAAAQAILASLINAHKVGGKWVAGPPTGQESNVQTVTFDNPSEYHDFLVYRDPATGRWNALEYNVSYDLQAPTALAAFMALPGYAPGYIRIQITGWDTRPVAMDRGALGAAAERQFFRLNPGRGRPGELLFLGGNNGLTAAGWLTPGLSVVGAIGPNELRTGIDGGLKLNYHYDIDRGELLGYARVAGGVYTSTFDASALTGDRGIAQRATYRTWILGIKADGRFEMKPKQLAGEHLSLRLGADFDGLAGIPIAASGPNTDMGSFVAAALDYSDLHIGLDGMLTGREHLSDKLTFDWALRARYDLDPLSGAITLVTSSGKMGGQQFGLDPLRADFALALTYKTKDVLTRFEVGGSQFWPRPFDREATPIFNEYAALTISPSSGVVKLGFVSKGEVLNGNFAPLDAIGVALNVNPLDQLMFGVGFMAASPDGRLSTMGQGLSANGMIGLRLF
jgi:hypothetical protein